MKKFSLFVLILTLVAMITACGSPAPLPTAVPEPTATTAPEPTATSAPEPTATDAPAPTEEAVAEEPAEEAAAEEPTEEAAAEEPTEEAAAEEPTEEAAEEEAAGDEDVQVIEVAMTTTGYDPSEVTVKAGSQIHFKLMNLDDEEHDLYNKKADIKVGVTARDTFVYEWVAPEKPGSYVAECTFHEGLQMTVVVE